MKRSVKEQIDGLTKEERRIYDAVIRDFPATRPESALDIAIKGGIRFQFYPK